MSHDTMQGMCVWTGGGKGLEEQKDHMTKTISYLNVKQQMLASVYKKNGSGSHYNRVLMESMKENKIDEHTSEVSAKGLNQEVNTKAQMTKGTVKTEASDIVTDKQAFEQESNINTQKQREFVTGRGSSQYLTGMDLSNCSQMGEHNIFCTNYDNNTNGPLVSTGCNHASGHLSQNSLKILNNLSSTSQPLSSFSVHHQHQVQPASSQVYGTSFNTNQALYQRSRKIRDRVRSGVSPVLFYLLIVLSLFVHPVWSQCMDSKACNPKPTNLVDTSFLTRSLEVTSVCGPNDSTNGTYRRIKTTLDDTDFTCEAGAHGKENLVDYNNEAITIANMSIPMSNADLDTYWQSENTITNLTQSPQCITVNLGDPFLIRSITAMFVSPHTPKADTTTDMRPRASTFSIRVGGEWRAVRHYAADCAASFPNVTSEVSDPNFNSTTTVCVESFYSTDEETFTGWNYGRQQVNFRPSTEFKEDFDRNAATQRHYTADAVRMCMQEPADNNELSSYYAVGGFEVFGACSCYGHADACTGINDHVCECGHNTHGDHCDQCLPLYNNKPWAVGYEDVSNACEDCGCNGHATSCVYDPEKGYGVCDSCTNRTTGDKCEWCEPHYYVNPLKDTYNASVHPAICTALNGSEEITYDCSDWCIPCNCSTEGTLANQMDCNNGTGQCHCKTFVEGRICGECMDGYWNLQENNVDGCQECVCSEEGTVNGSLCDKVMGTCTCKENVMGSDCDVCKPGTYNLTTHNALGCTSCDCDLGAATTSSCNNQTGVCACREGIGGRECDQPLPGRYVPKLDYLTFEAEMADLAEEFEIIERSGQGTLDTTLTGRGFVRLPAESSYELEVVVPETFDYNVVVRYESSYSWTNFGLVFRAVNVSDEPDSTYECAGESHDVTTDLFDSADLPAAETRGGVELSSRDTCLRADTVYRVSISVPRSEPPGGSILLDSIVLLPNYTLLAAYNHTDTQIQAQMDACYQSSIAVDLRAREDQSCDIQEYSIMSEFFAESMLCFCNETGSESSVCEPLSGQCTCKPNVILQDCSQCSVGFYNYTSGEGCTACNCDPLGSLPRTCNEDGTCPCQPNVIGEKCDQCLPEHYGLASGEGCKLCTCNNLYSLNNSCMDNAQCHCKPGVGGANCDRCIDGAFHLSKLGCDMCGCDESGSFEQGCDPEDGMCLCRRNVQGNKCDSCKEGFYGLGDWTPLGCLQCVCSGHSNNCTSAPGWFKTRQESNWSLLDGEQALQDIWTGTDGQGNPVDVSNPVIIDNEDSQYVMRIYNRAEHENETLYFVATEKFLGNKASAYNRVLNFSIGHFIPGPQLQDFVIEYINNTEGDVILKGRYSDYSLVARLPQYPVDAATDYQYMLHEDQWKVDTVDGPNATYTQMIQILSDLEAIWIRAKYTNVTNSYSNLYQMSIEFSAQHNATTEIPANNVEQCTCPEEYMGQFCEQCAPGYQRDPHNSGPYSPCIPCACNNHGAEDMPCDPETGMCMCMNNTVGDHCELCAPGYYGDATEGTPEDCQPCQCPGNVVESAINVFSELCELKSGGGFTCTQCEPGHGGDRCDYCTDNYYGTPEVVMNNNGACTPCECNGRADTCNSTTGMCIDCRNNTAGKECHICAPGYHGNAMEYDCQPCNCTAVGATGECDPATGQCVCHPNVLGFLCEGPCADFTFNYSSGLGCEPCDCHPEGASGSACNMDSGQCVCRSNVMGRRCDQCEDTYWDITSAGCSPCGCTQEGTLNDTSAVFGTCELESGQCDCALPGIIGRTCDRCATGTLGVTYEFVTDVYIGQYPQCELCGECYDNWARKIDDLGLRIDELYHSVLMVWSSYDNLTTSEVQPLLESLQGNLTGVTSSIETAQDMVDSLNFLQNAFSEVIANIENLTSVLNTHMAGYNAIQVLLDSIQEFDGAVSTESRSTQTPAEINEASIQLQSNVESLFQTGNISFIKIQRMSQIIANSSQLVQSLMDDVSIATQLLGSARLTRETAAILLGGTLAQSFNNNAQTLSNLGENLLSVNSDIDVVNASLTANAQDVENRNISVYEHLELTENKMAAITETMVEAQKAKANITQAETVVTTAVGEVRTYRATAVSTKQTSQYLIEQIVLQNQKIPGLNAQKTESQLMVAAIDDIDLLPLSDMESLVTEINETPVSQTEVNEMLLKASTARRTAESAQEITETAEQESQTTLEYVRQINNNLQEGSRTNDTTLNDLDRSQQTVTLIEDTLTEVQSTITNATSLAGSTEASLMVSEGLVEQVSQCFTDKTDRIEQATDTADTAQAFIQQVISSQDAAENSQDQASVQISELETLTDNAYDLVVQAEDEMASLQAQMDALEEVSTLQALYNDMVSQLIQMELLERDLNTYDSEIDTLLTSLTELQAEAPVSCTQN